MTLRRALRRLRLKKGDILIVRDRDLLMRLGEYRDSGLDFSVPLIYVEGKHDLEIKRGNNG